MQSKTNVDQMLAESFKDLTLRMPIDKITIKQITDGAGVIRPTFYNHFQDKYGLLEWIIRTEILDPVRSSTRKSLGWKDRILVSVLPGNSLGRFF